MSNIALNKKRRLTRWKKYLPYFFMVLPGILYLIIFKYIPMFGSYERDIEWCRHIIFRIFFAIIDRKSVV